MEICELLCCSIIAKCMGKHLGIIVNGWLSISQSPLPRKGVRASSPHTLKLHPREPPIPWRFTRAICRLSIYTETISFLYATKSDAVRGDNCRITPCPRKDYISLDWILHLLSAWYDLARLSPQISLVRGFKMICLYFLFSLWTN